jgi:hypothetical protein
VWLLTSRAPRWRSAITRSSCTEPLYRTALSRATASLATVTRAAWLLMRASPFCLVHGCPGRAPQCGQPTVRTSARSSMRSRAYCGMGRRVGSRARARPEGSTPPAARFIRSAWSAHSSPSSLRQGRRGSAAHRRQMYSRARRAPPDTGRAYRRSRRRCSVNPGQARHLACAASAACGCPSGAGGAGWHSCPTCACACGGAGCPAHPRSCSCTRVPWTRGASAGHSASGGCGEAVPASCRSTSRSTPGVEGARSSFTALSTRPAG